jgi:hypothetical protein
MWFPPEDGLIRQKHTGILKICNQLTEINYVYLDSNLHLASIWIAYPTDEPYQCIHTFRSERFWKHRYGSQRNTQDKRFVWR